MVCAHTIYPEKKSFLSFFFTINIYPDYNGFAPKLLTLTFHATLTWKSLLLIYLQACYVQVGGLKNLFSYISADSKLFEQMFGK